MFGLETTSPCVSVAASIPVARAFRPTRRGMRTLVDVSEELRPGRGTITVEDLELASEEELWTDDTGADHSGWFCVSTEPFPCPAAGCTFVAEFLTAAPLVLVW